MVHQSNVYFVSMERLGSETLKKMRVFHSSHLHILTTFTNQQIHDKYHAAVSMFIVAFTGHG